MRKKLPFSTRKTLQLCIIFWLIIFSQPLLGQVTLIKDCVPGTSSSSVLLHDTINNKILLSYTDPVYGYELFVSDGTDAGTVLLKDINVSGNSSPSGFFRYNGHIYFSAIDAANGRELWRTDGTPAGTILIKDINAGVMSSSPSGFNVLNGELMFFADDGIMGGELWKTDGTTAGTVLVKDVNSGVSGSYHGASTVANGILFFSAYDGINGVELWKSDGTDAGTVMIKDLHVGGQFDGSNPENLITVGNTVFFKADDGSSGKEVWKSDGTSAGTVLVQDLNPGSSNSIPNTMPLIEINGKVLFYAYDGGTNSGIWTTDGTAAGTFFITPGSIAYTTEFNGEIYFTSSANEILKTDGTVAGSVPIKNVGAILTNSKVIGTKFYFTGNNGDGVTGDELWESDGTTSGTVFVHDIYPGTYEYDPGFGIVHIPNSSNPSNFIYYNGIPYFTATDSAHGKELYAVLPPCQNPDIPTLAISADSVCKGGNVTISISSSDSLREATEWVLYSGSCGGQLMDQNATGNFTVTIDSNQTFFVRGEGGCALPGNCGSTSVKIISTSFGSDVLSSCDSAYINGNWYYSSTSVIDTLIGLASSGCDSIVTTTLTILNTPITNLTLTACDSALVAGNVYYSSQVVYDTLAGVNCDSIVATNLTIYNTPETIIQLDGCDSLEFNGQYYFTNTIINDTLSGAHCDSIVKYELSISNHNSVHIDTNLTIGDTLILNSGAYTTDGIYIDSLLNEFGCDSIVTFTVSFDPNGVNDLLNSEPQLILYPNPATDLLLVKLKDQQLVHSEGRIYNSIGREVMHVQNLDTPINVGSLSTGIYTIQVRLQNYTYTTTFYKRNF